MASRTITAAPRFAAGSTLSAWPAINVTPGGVSGVPVAAGVVDAAGRVSFSGLTPDGRYVAGSSAAGPFITFTVDPEVPSSVGGSSGSVNARSSEFGVHGDGVTDDRAAINAAIARAEAIGAHYVDLDGGDFLVNGTLNSLAAGKVRLRGTGPETRLIQGADALVVSATGTDPSSDLTTLSADANWGAETLTVTSATGIAVGDYLLVGADAAFETETPLRFRGEIVRVKQIAGTTVTLYSPLRDTYTTAASAGVRKLTFVRGVGVEQLALVNPSPGTRTAGLAYFGTLLRPEVHDVWLEGGDGAGLTFDQCLDGEVDGVRAFNFTDDAANGRYGYGINLTRACENFTIANGVFRRLRHAFTTGSVDNKRGVSRHVTVSDSVAAEMLHSAFDTHAECEDITFRGLKVQGGRMAAYNHRGKSCNVEGCTALDTAAGVSFSADAIGGTAKGNTLKRIGFITPAAAIQKSALYTLAPNTTIVENDVEGCAEHGVLLDSVKGGRIVNNRLHNVALSNPSGGLYGVRVIGAAVDPLLIERNRIEHDPADTRPGMLATTVVTSGIHFDSASAKAEVRENRGYGITTILDASATQQLLREGNRTTATSLLTDGHLGIISIPLAAWLDVSGVTAGEYATSKIRYKELADSALGILQAQCQVPNDAIFGSTITVRVRWSTPATAGNARFTADFHALTNNSTNASTDAGVSTSATTTAPGTAGVMASTDMLDSGFVISPARLLVVRVSRDGAHVGDTLADVVRIEGIDVLYVRN